MYVPDIELHETASVEEAATLLGRYAPDARLLAGGTDLLVDLKTGRTRVSHVISIDRIDSLRGVSATQTGLRIGALTTVTQMADSPIVRERFAPILDATRDMAAPQIRNLATVGGNIASAVPCADLPPILMVMGAIVVLRSPHSERTVPLESFFVGPRQTVLRENEMLTFIDVPRIRPGFGAAYARLAPREGNAIAVVSVAAGLLLDDDAVREAHIAIGAVAPIPKLVESAGTLLSGRQANDEAFEDASTAAMKAAEPISDVRGSADYRRRMVGVLTRRALAAARRRAKETQSRR